MFTACIRKQRAVGRAFWLVILVWGGAAQPEYGPAASPIAQANLAWADDDDPDEGGQTA
jgi:hypothetical protein